jgi:hypothetical protein
MMTHANSDSVERSELAPIVRVGSVAGSAIRDRIAYILSRSPNQMNEAAQIARIIEAEDSRKRGSMHLAVKREMRRMESARLVCVLPPLTRWDSYTLCLLPNGKAIEPRP